MKILVFVVQFWPSISADWSGSHHDIPDDSQKRYVAHRYGETLYDVSKKFTINSIKI